MDSLTVMNLGDSNRSNEILTVTTSGPHRPQGAAAMGHDRDGERSREKTVKHEFARVQGVLGARGER